MMFPLIFTSREYGLIFWTIYGVWVVSLIVSGFLSRPRTAAEKRDRGAAFILRASMILGLFLAFFAATGFRQADLPNATIYFWIGITAMLAGCSFGFGRTEPWDLFSTSPSRCRRIEKSCRPAPMR